MRRTGLFTAALIATAMVLAPGLAMARAGGGASMGSRGGMTFSAPRSTNTAPGYAAPMQRSLTAPAAPSYGARPGYGAQPAFGGRSSFMSGLAGGLLGAGIGGMLFGGGLFHGISGFGGILGFLLQIFLIVMVVRFLFRMFTGSRQPAFAGPGMFARMGQPGQPMGGGGAAAPMAPPVAISPADYQAYEQLLQQVQAAWTAHDLGRLQAIVTPEMVSYFSEQLSDQASRGVRNSVSDVRLEQGDLSEAWSEQGREYATVAMRFSMVDCTRDSSGRVVEGDPAARTQATELWTFVRASGGRWLLSAIQQTR